MSGSKHSVMALLKAMKVPCRNSYDRLMIVNHAFMLTEGYRLVAAGQKAASLLDVDQSAPEVQLDGWQDMEDEYAFAYASEGNKPGGVLVTGLDIDETLVIHYLCPKTEVQPSAAELPVNDYIKDPKSPDAAEGLTEVGDLLDLMSSALASANTVEKKEPDDSQLQQSSSDPEAPLRNLREMPDIPLGEDDDIEAGVLQGHLPGRPGIIGDPDDPGVWGDREGRGLGILDGRGNLGGDGMHVGPGHPIFARRFPAPDRAGGVPDMPRPGGLPGNLPEGPMPGVRFDPIAPEGQPGFNAHDFQRRRDHMGHAFHPDLEFPGGPLGGRGGGLPDLGGGGFRDPFI